MPQKSPIEWTNYTSNPLYVTLKETGKRGWHCNKPSAGCGHCYAETLNKRFGTGLDFVGRNADKLNFFLNNKELLEIIKLNDRLARKNETAKLFLCDMTDLFLENHTKQILDRMFAVIALCPNITFQVLTKRAERMKKYFENSSSPWLDSLEEWWEYEPQLARSIEGWAASFGGDYLENLWLGVSVENQKAADERIPLLLETPAAIRWLSCEPLLEKVDLTFVENDGYKLNCLTGTQKDMGRPCEDAQNKIDWVIVGGESGNGARDCEVHWIRKLVKQCQSAKVPVFVKQLGSKPYVRDLIVSGYLPISNKKGGNIEEFPTDLQIREYPK